MKRRYSYFKEKSSNFIGDDDEVIESVPVPDNLPDWIPEEAWLAYVDIWFPENPEDANVYDIEERYEGYFQSEKDFVEYYFQYIYYTDLENSIDYDDTFEDSGNLFFDLNIANLDEIGRFIFRSKYGNAVFNVVESDEGDIEDTRGFIGDNDTEPEQETELLPFEDERDNSIYKRMVEIMTQEHPGDDYEDYAKAYIIAVSEYDDVSPIDVVNDLQKENPDKRFIVWENGEYYLFEDDYVYYDGYVFRVY